jgi:SNF2 family DNA or RNA helicase
VALGFLVADEAHYAKNPEAARSQAFARLVPRAERVALLTGTPMENRVSEFRTLVSLLRPEVAERLGADAGLAGDAVVSPREFRRAVAPVYLRRNQQDVLRELPPRVVYEEWVDLDAAGEAAYREAALGRNLMAMRRVVTCSEPGATSAKMARLAEILAEHEESGRKVLVFSWFLDALREVARRFEAVGVIDGSTPPPERMELVDRFQAAEGHALLAGQILAAGQGLNLQAAGAVVILEPQFKPTLEEQAIARAHRMGQTQTVLVHRLLARRSVDERLLELLAGKMDLFRAYARESLIRDSSREATETSLTRLVLDAEEARMRSTGS